MSTIKDYPNASDVSRTKESVVSLIGILYGRNRLAGFMADEADRLTDKLFEILIEAATATSAAPAARTEATPDPEPVYERRRAEDLRIGDVVEDSNYHDKHTKVVSILPDLDFGPNFMRINFDNEMGWSFVPGGLYSDVKFKVLIETDKPPIMQLLEAIGARVISMPTVADMRQPPQPAAEARGAVSHAEFTIERTPPLLFGETTSTDDPALVPAEARGDVAASETVAKHTPSDYPPRLISMSDYWVFIPDIQAGHYSAYYIKNWDRVNSVWLRDEYNNQASINTDGSQGLEFIPENPDKKIILLVPNGMSVEKARTVAQPPVPAASAGADAHVVGVGVQVTDAELMLGVPNQIACFDYLHRLDREKECNGGRTNHEWYFDGRRDNGSGFVCRQCGDRAWISDTADADTVPARGGKRVNAGNSEVCAYIKRMYNKTIYSTFLAQANSPLGIEYAINEFVHRYVAEDKQTEVRAELRSKLRR